MFYYIVALFDYLNQAVTIMTIDEMIKRYNIKLAHGSHEGQIHILNTDMVYADKAIDTLKSNKPAIMDRLREMDEARKEATRQYIEKVNSIPGLTEIQEALDAQEEWENKFSEYFDSEDCGKIPINPNYDFEAAYKKYPQAHAYLLAEKESLKSNFELADIGKRALKEIIYGDWKKAIANMKKEKDDFIARHIWDQDGDGIIYLNNDGPGDFIERCFNSINK